MLGASDEIHLVLRKTNMNLSIIMPVYNEVSTIQQIVSAVQSVPIEKEIIIVDDFSTDGTREKLKSLEVQDNIRVLLHEKNQGKGASLRTGYAAARNDIVIVQDADLEYNPNEYPILIAPILDGRADVVYGSRFIGGQSHRVLYFWHSIGNRFLTLLSNCLSDMNMTDMETCYKAFRREVIQSIDIWENRFGVEPETTAVSTAALKQAIAAEFYLSPVLFVVPVLVLVMVVMKVDAVVAIFVGAAAGGLLAVACQPKVVTTVAGLDKVQVKTMADDGTETTVLKDPVYVKRAYIAFVNAMALSTKGISTDRIDEWAAQAAELESQIGRAHV